MTNKKSAPIADAEAALREARELHARLFDRRTEASRRHAELADQRRAAALDGLTGDEAAQERLAALTRAAAEAGLDLENLDAAISAAADRVSVAEAALANERRRTDARKARELLARMRERGSDASTALHGFMTALKDFAEVGNQVRRLGPEFGMPSVDLQRVGTRIAIDTALMHVGLQQDFLRPSARRTFVDIVDGWALQIESRICPILGEPQPESPGKREDEAA